MISSSGLKGKLREIFDDESQTSGSRYFHVAMSCLILLNILALIIETVPAFQQKHQTLFHFFEIFSVSVFTAEYVLRFWLAPNKKAFILSPMSLIDLFAILPFYLPYLHADLRVLRTFRLLRLLRILKLARYSSALQSLIGVIVHKKHELLIAASFGAMMLVLTSSGIYFLENPVQPDKFTSIPDAMWWSVVTLTTVGYGDIYPITLAGRILGGLTAFFGIGMFALPAGILASGFAEMIHKDDKIELPELLINIDVANIARATEFYEDCFHLRVARRLGDTCVELSGFKYPIYLLEKPDGSPVSPAAAAQRNFQRHWTPVHLDFVVPDLHVAVRRAKQAGAILEGEPRSFAWGKMALLSDPFGNGFCLIEWIGKGYDEVVPLPK